MAGRHPTWRAARRTPAGADAINQFLAAGLVDELELHVVPIILGGGARLFAGVAPDLRLEPIRTVEAPGVTHLKYRVAR